MYKTTVRSTKRANHGDHAIHDDLAKIKHALFQATTGLRGRASEALSQSIDDVKERSAAMQENLGLAVAKKPFKSVGAALGIGVLIGYFMHK
jgi:ElaB/YqjD/DUF883 family membrane-anchored ribosome-binding protein